MKIAQGGCVTNEMIKRAARDKDIEVSPFLYFPCMVDIEKEGLDIPMSKIYEHDYVKGRAETSKFVEKTIDMDLNRKTLSTYENSDADYIIIELASLIFPAYKVYYNDKWVYSVNIEAPRCYEMLGLKYEKVELTDEIIYKGLNDFADYMRKKWDLNKIILYKEPEPKFYMGEDGKVYSYPMGSYNYESSVRLNRYIEYLYNLLPETKMFINPSLQICNSLTDNPRHMTEESKVLQSLVFRKFILHEDLEKEISEAQLTLQKILQEKLALSPITLIQRELYGSC